MSVDPSFSFDLYPGLDAELEAAYRRNVESGNASPEIVASEGLTAVIAQKINEAQGADHEDISDDFRARFATARTATYNLYSRENSWSVPDIGDHELIDTDWQGLSKKYEAMQQHDLQPEIVLSYGDMSLDKWKNIYGKLDPTGTKNGGLYIDDEVAAAWSDLNGEAAWTVSVIAASPKPNVVNVSHDLHQGEAKDFSKIGIIFKGVLEIDGEDAIRNSYPTLSEYLTLQGTRLNAGQEPIDGETATWLKGTFDNNSKAPGAYWAPVGGRVYVYWYEPDARFGDLGVRPAVRGVEF